LQPIQSIRWSCGRVARQSSAKASTAVRIRSRPLKFKSLQFGGFFYALILDFESIELS
jgi:hypothetical protein